MTTKCFSCGGEMWLFDSVIAGVGWQCDLCEIKIAITTTIPVIPEPRWYHA